MNYAIIAAGNGSRLAEEGELLPKPLVKIVGVPMIKRLIDSFVANGASSVSIIINDGTAQLKEYLDALSLPIPLNVVVRTTHGSMHSFYELKGLLGDGKFCLATVDSVFDPVEFKGYIDAFVEDEDNDCLMAVTQFIDDEKPLYVAVSPEMDITSFSDEAWDGVKYVSGGIYCMSRTALDVLEACMDAGICDMRNYQRALVSAGLKVKAYEFAKIVDVDHVHDIATANEFISNLNRVE